MPREGPVVTARRWAKNHALCELLLPGHVDSFARLRYEDSVEHRDPNRFEVTDSPCPWTMARDSLPDRAAVRTVTWLLLLRHR